MNMLITTEEYGKLVSKNHHLESEIQTIRLYLIAVLKDAGGKITFPMNLLKKSKSTEEIYTMIDKENLQYTLMLSSGVWFKD